MNEKFVSPPKDVVELRDRLNLAFAKMENDPRQRAQVQELANVAGKILGTLKIQLEYHMMRCEEPDIPYAGPTSGKRMKMMPRNMIQMVDDSKPKQLAR